MTMHDFMQTWVLLCSGTAVWLVARTDKWQRWGYILGLLSEPAWLYGAWKAQQWGVILLVAWYCYSWSCGAWRRFAIRDAAA